MHYQEVRNMISDVMLITEDGEVVAAGTRDQMHSFVKHHVEDGDYVIIEGVEAVTKRRHRVADCHRQDQAEQRL